MVVQFREIALASLDKMLLQMGSEQDIGGDVDEDALSTVLLHVATDIIHQITNRMFVPMVDTRTFDARGSHINTHIDSRRMQLHDDLLSATTVTNGDATVITADKYRLIPATGAATAIELLDSSAYTWTYSTDWQNAISIAGIWGYHEDDYADAWVDTGDSVQDAGGINASVQTITVTDADGKDARYDTRFEVEHLLQLEDEFLRVVGVDTAANTLTVLRGQLGSTAATHDQDTTIERWAVMGNIEKACLDLGLWLYRNRATGAERITLFGDHTEVVKNDLPLHIAQTLETYTRPRTRRS